MQSKIVLCCFHMGNSNQVAEELTQGTASLASGTPVTAGASLSTLEQRQTSFPLT